jgi:hypothetical protein
MGKMPWRQKLAEWHAMNRRHAALRTTLQEGVRKPVMADWETFPEDMSKKLAQACDAEEVERVRSVLRYFRSGGWKSKASCAEAPRMVLLEDGAPAKTPTAAAPRWQRLVAAATLVRSA